MKIITLILLLLVVRIAPAQTFTPTSQDALKSFFVTGAVPTQTNYAALIDTLFYYINQTYSNAAQASLDASNAVVRAHIIGSADYDIMSASSPTDTNGSILIYTNIVLTGVIAGIDASNGFYLTTHNLGANSSKTVSLDFYFSPGFAGSNCMIDVPSNLIATNTITSSALLGGQYPTNFTVTTKCQLWGAGQFAAGPKLSAHVYFYIPQ